MDMNVSDVMAEEHLAGRQRAKVSSSVWLKRFGLGFLAVVAYYVMFQCFYNMIAFKELYPYEDLHELLRGITLNFLPVSSVFCLNVIVVFFGIRRVSTFRKICADVVFSYILMSVVNWVYLWITDGVVDWAGMFFNNTIIFLGVEAAYYVTHFRESVRRTEEQKQLALKYRYDALKAQINPHFLFNSLNILYSLVSLDRKESTDFILSLSDMYRYIMAQQDCDRIPLSREMGFLDSYANVLAMRYHNQFRIEVQGRENVGNREIIPYTLQLLIENVAKHNVVSTRHPMTVTVAIEPDAITVTNPIVPMEAATASSSSIGLKYICGLYRRFGREFRVENDGKTFRAIVPLLPPSAKVETE